MKKFHQMLPKRQSRNALNKGKMKRKFNLTAPKATYAFGAVLLVGSITSALLTTDNRWINWHFSRLGEGGKISADIFNLSLIIAAIVSFSLSNLYANNIAKFSEIIDFNHKRAISITSRVFMSISICLMGVALFPFDKFPTIHNVFGYLMTFSILLLCGSAPFIMPFLSKRFSQFSSVVVVSAVLLFGVYFMYQALSLLTVELIMYVLIYVWLIWFALSLKYPK